MSRLPKPGGDEGIWAQLLNDFLSVAHTTTGAITSGAIGSDQIQPNTITDTHVQTISQSKISNLQTDLHSAAAKNMWMIAKASGFIKTMMRSGTAVTTPSVIRVDHIYDSSYTGEVSGSFDLVGVTRGSEQRCPIRITTPVGAIADSYFGTVTGTVAGYISLPSDSYVIKAYKTTDADYEQPSIATVDINGNFNLDLSNTPNTRQGSWKFALCTSSNAQIGAKWPQQLSYTNLEIRHSVVSDATYPVANQPALIDGTFSFPSTQVGFKQFQLVDTVTSEILAEYVTPTGNVRSYLVTDSEPGYGTNFVHYCYSYDQAITLLAMLAMGDTETARQLAKGLLRMQALGGTHDGGFVFAAPQLSPSFGNGYYRTGAHSIATYALLCYIEACPNDATQDYRSAVTRALTYLDSVLSHSGRTAGLYLGGTGLYTTQPNQPEIFNQAYDITWAATEHNLDTWHALHKAGEILDSSYTAKATALQSAILVQLWDPVHSRFYQGMQPNGPDGSDPLDVHTWGAIWLHAIGRDDLAQKTLNPEALTPLQFTQNGIRGYAPAYPGGGYPSALQTIWSEGTFGAALAYLSIGDTVNWQACIDGIALSQQADGSFRYVTVADSTYQFTSSKSTIGAAWAILAALGHGIWDVTVPRS